MSTPAHRPLTATPSGRLPAHHAKAQPMAMASPGTKILKTQMMNQREGSEAASFRTSRDRYGIRYLNTTNNANKTICQTCLALRILPWNSQKTIDSITTGNFYFASRKCKSRYSQALPTPRWQWLCIRLCPYLPCRSRRRMHLWNELPFHENSRFVHDRGAKNRPNI